MLSLAINLSQILRRNKKLSSPRKTKACSRYCRDRLGVRPGVKILLKNLRSSFESLRTNGEAVEIMGDFSVHAERVEAFLGFFSIIRFWIPTLPFLFRVLIRRYHSGQFSCFEVAPAVRQPDHLFVMVDDVAA